MALAKTGYEDAVKGTTTEKVYLNADGFIAQSGETTAGAARFSFNNANAANTRAVNNAIFAAFLGFVGGSSDTLSNTFQVKWSEAVED